MSEPGRWADLVPRLISAAVLVIVATIELLLGGLWFETFVGAACGLMIWELTRMISPKQHGLGYALAAVIAFCVVMSYHVPPQGTILLLGLPALMGMAVMSGQRGLWAIVALWVAVAGFGFIWVRESLGLGWMVWLICVVVASDVAGYFVGRVVGGPKFWPRVSPKKTWSGTLGGWVFAGLVGLGWVIWGNASLNLIGVSVLAAMAAQAGDIAESAVKRTCGVKDSSALIPGHGGFLDRFDGMMGASVLVLLVTLVWQPGAV